MTKDNLESVARTLELAAEYLRDWNLKRYMCLDCGLWNAKEQKCNKYNCVPPPNIIMQVEKCPEFEIEISF